MPTSELEAVQLTGVGAVAELERKLREHYGMRYALCVSSATTGLLAVALALGLRKTDFLTTPYTYGASLAGWLLLGNRPIFADIEAETLVIDAGSARRRITRRTKAILAVDIFGVPCDAAALRKVADEHGLWYVADAAQSFGARRDGHPASALADALVLSFTVGKTLSAGEGGAVLTNHSDLYEKLVWWTQHPHRQHRDLGLSLDNEFALNGRIHPWAARTALSTLTTSLEEVRARQRECFEILDVLNATGLTEPVRFRKSNIEPAFFRLTAAWKGAPRPDVLQALLQRRGFAGELLPAPVRLIYRQAAFLSQYGRRMPRAPRCPVAARQALRRFAVRDLSRQRISSEASDATAMVLSSE